MPRLRKASYVACHYMNTPKYSKLDREEKLVLIITYVVVLIGLLFAFICLSEFYHVRLAGHGSTYAFGPVADNQWYYQNATIYSSYNLVSGLLFFMNFIASLWGTIKKNRKILLMSVGMTVILLLATIISSFIQ
jgi:hypothetical protein